MLDEPEGVAAELKVVATLVDAVRPVALDVDPAFHIREKIVKRHAARFEPDVGDAYHRHALPSVGAVGPVRARLADLGSHLPIRAVAHEDAVPHDVPALAGNAVIVVAGGRQRLGLSIVGHQVHVRRAVAEASALLGGEKARPRVVGFIAERPIQFARMTAGFMDRQGQVLRVEDEIVLPRVHLRRPNFLHRLRGDARCLSQELGLGDQLVAAPQMRRVEAARRKLPALHGRRAEFALASQKVEANAGTIGRG